MFTSAGRAGRAPTLTVIDERGRKREAAGEAEKCAGGGGGGRKIGKESRLSPVIRGGGIPRLRGGGVRRGVREDRSSLMKREGGGREGERRGDYVWHQERADNYLY